MQKTRKEIIDRAEHFGLHIETWAPGDGATRYRVFTEKRDYHAGGEIFTALGIKELDIFVMGWIAHTRSAVHA